MTPEHKAFRDSNKELETALENIKHPRQDKRFEESFPDYQKRAHEEDLGTMRSAIKKWEKINGRGES